MNIILYSTKCPKCKMLESRLKENNIDFVENNDVDLMIEKGFTTVPVLEVDGVAYGFKDAVEWIKER